MTDLFFRNMIYTNLILYYDDKKSNFSENSQRVGVGESPIMKALVKNIFEYLTKIFLKVGLGGIIPLKIQQYFIVLLMSELFS